MLYKVPYNGKWKQFTDKDLLKWKDNNKDKHDFFQNRMIEYEKNPLQFFLSHGRKWTDKETAYADNEVIIPPCKYKPELVHDGRAFLSDRKSQLQMMVALSQGGKAQPYDAKIQTPNGEVNMGNIKVGDKVIGSDGSPCNVLKIFEQGEQDVYKIDFDKGEVSTECTLDHLWKILDISKGLVWDNAKRRNKRKSEVWNPKWEVLSTEDIIKRDGIGSEKYKHLKKPPSKKCRIPNCKPVQYKENKFFIDPYLLGVLLGDGCILYQPKFTSKDEDLVDEILDKIEINGYDLTTSIQENKCNSYSIVKKDKKKTTNSLGQFVSDNKYWNEIKRLKLAGKHSDTKFIPEEYKYTSVKNRIELLRGLMDTDGYIDKKSCMEYSTVSKQLALDVLWLVRSLGGKAKYTTKYPKYKYKGEVLTGKLAYSVVVKHSSINPFFIERKASRWYPIKRMPERVLYSIVKTNKRKNCRCILVDSSDNTYLTDNFIVTHNTFIGTAWSALRIIPTDPDWEIYKENGIEYQEWDGPKIWVVASYSWQNVKTLFNSYISVLPRHELLNYSPRWGKFDGENGKQRTKSFGDSREKEIDLACGSKLMFLCYSQKISAWEGFVSDGAHLDEQPPKEHFISWSRSTNTRGDYTPSAMTLTGYVLPDRPDTGAAGWVKRELYDGLVTRGLSVSRYHIGMDDVPDAIVSAKKKKERYDEWANPSIKRSEADVRRAIARYFGGWEPGSGSVFDEFRKNIHIINPLWKDNKVPRSYTLYRSIDFGSTDVTCCIWFAVSPKGIVYVYRMYYEKGVNIAEASREIIRMSNNEQIPLGAEYREDYDFEFKTYEEKAGQENGEVYYATLLDSRSGSNQQLGMEIREIFENYGIDTEPASGKKDAIQIPCLKDYLRIDHTKGHSHNKNKDGNPINGMAKMLFFDGFTDDAIDELESCERDPTDNNKINKKAKTHAIDCLKYMASYAPDYLGDMKIDYSENSYVFDEKDIEKGENFRKNNDESDFIADDDSFSTGNGTPYSNY